MSEHAKVEETKEEKEFPKKYPRLPVREKTKMPSTTPPDPPKIRKKKIKPPKVVPDKVEETAPAMPSL